MPFGALFGPLGQREIIEKTLCFIAFSQDGGSQGGIRESFGTFGRGALGVLGGSFGAPQGSSGSPWGGPGDPNEGLGVPCGAIWATQNH